MPLYPFACNVCAAEFDASRDVDDLVRPAACPIDGAPAHRVYGVPPARSADGSEAALQRAVPWGSFIHDHGPGTEPHLHGAGTPFHAS